MLALSNNVGAARIGLRLGGDALYDAFRRFGFGTVTGIELAAEEPGTVWHPDQASGELTTAQMGEAVIRRLEVTGVVRTIDVPEGRWRPTAE